MYTQSCQPSVFFLENRSPVRFMEIDQIVRIFKNCQVTAEKYTYHTIYTVHACTCIAHELQKFTYYAGNSMVRKNAAKIRKNIARIRKTQTGGWQL